MGVVTAFSGEEQLTGAPVCRPLMGADLAYLGTRFINTCEALAPAGHKEMILASTAKDIVYTSAISGVHGNFLRASIIAAGADPDNLQSSVKLAVSSEGEAKAWKDVWSAGQGVGNIHDIPRAAELCQRLVAEHREAIARFNRTGPAAVA